MKRKWVAVMLAIFLGGFGIHRFYLRQPEMGIVYLAIYLWTRVFSVFNFPIATILGWIDAYRYMMMDHNEFDRRYNSHNFRDRYGNRRQAPQRTSTGRYIVIEDDVKPKDRSFSNKYRNQKERKESEVFKQSGIKKFKNFDIEGAISDFEKALHLNPDDPATHFNVACAYSIEERALDAFRHIDQAFALGFSDRAKVLTHEALAFIRIMPPFEKFKANQFRLNSEIYQEIEQQQNQLLESLKQKKEKEKEQVLQPGGTYGSMFQDRINDPFI